MTRNELRERLEQLRRELNMLYWVGDLRGIHAVREELICVLGLLEQKEGWR